LQGSLLNRIGTHNISGWRLKVDADEKKKERANGTVRAKLTSRPRAMGEKHTGFLYRIGRKGMNSVAGRRE